MTDAVVISSTVHLLKLDIYLDIYIPSSISCKKYLPATLNVASNLLKIGNFLMED